MGAGESGMLSRPARRRTAVEQPLTGPLARAAGLRGPARAHWVCPVPLSPSSAVSHPGDVRAGKIGSDQARSVCKFADPAAPWGEDLDTYTIYSRAAKLRALIIKPSMTTPRAMPEVCREKKNSEGGGRGEQPRGVRRSVRMLLRTEFRICVVDVLVLGPPVALATCSCRRRGFDWWRGQHGEAVARWSQCQGG